MDAVNLRLSGFLLVLCWGCGSEPQPDVEPQADAGDVAIEVATGCSTPDPSLTCQDTGCDAGHDCVVDPIGCTPSSCSCSNGVWECTEDCGPSYLCTTETSPLPSCGSVEDRGECDGLGVCEWVEPAGCPDPNTYILQTGTCFPQGRCESDAECPSGYFCEAWTSVSPRCSWEEPLCDACNDPRPLCLPVE